MVLGLSITPVKVRRPGSTKQGRGHECLPPLSLPFHTAALWRLACSRNLARETAWEAVMRIRCSKGLRISAFFGHFFIRSTDLLALPACDVDKVGAGLTCALPALPACSRAAHSVARAVVDT